MSATTEKSRAAGAARIELVDNWHLDWPKVLKHVERFGRVDGLLIDADGWLSARQNLLAALTEERVVAHLGFRVQPAQRSRRGKLPCVEARLDTYGLDPVFRNRAIEVALRDTAIQRAKQLKCHDLQGFDLPDSWT